MPYSSTRSSSRPFSRGGGGFSRGRRAMKPKTFDPSHLVRQAAANAETRVSVTPEAYVPKHSFADFALPEILKQNVAKRGYTQPTAIQDQAIPVLLEGRDVVGVAHTGTGKTAAFLLPLIAKAYKDRSQRVLVVTPTRELAVQIEQEFRQFSENTKLYSVICIGGVNIRPQINRLQRQPHFVIGTPGRLRDLEMQGALYFDDYQNIVLDEVDQMLDMGFIRDVKHITSRLASPRQSLFFSATMPDSVTSIMRSILRDPVKITIPKRDTTGNINQDVVKVGGQSKVDVLHQILRQPEVQKTIVFVRTKRGAEQLSRALDQRGVLVAAIHGNKSQPQRQRAIDGFKRNQVNVLLATDVASRGLDIDDVSHVINFDLPESLEDYTHRIGRTGRANKTGVALTLVD